MTAEPQSPRLSVEPAGQGGGTCDCCRSESRTVWGWVCEGGSPVAAYFVQWTVGAPLDAHPANIDLILGPWGDAARPEDRVAIATLHFVQDDRPGVMLIDAATRPRLTESGLAAKVLRREEVLNTPLAARAFALIDAILLDDPRLRPEDGAPP